MARTVLAMSAALAMLAPAFPFAADAQPNALSNAQFERALRDSTTNTPFVLVTVVNGASGARQEVCVKVLDLVGALAAERGLGRDDAVAFALAQSDRTFKLSNKDALKQLVREYSDQALEDARAFLSKMTNEEVEAAARNQRSSFYDFINRKPLERGMLQAVAHVLSERGLLTSAECKPGMIVVER
jgi:hypothetical protein